jgi:hypothetical protein
MMVENQGGLEVSVVPIAFLSTSTAASESRVTVAVAPLRELRVELNERSGIVSPDHPNPVGI